MISFRWLPWIPILFLGSVISRAETVSSQRLNATHRLHPLKKVTVGPDDQYQGVVGPTGTELIFTRKSDLVPQLFKQSLTTGEITAFLARNADSQEPMISEDGWVAFTYYKYNARGDICYKRLSKDSVKLRSQEASDDGVQCLEIEDGERSSPFWKGPHELGYLVRDPRNSLAKIEVQSLDTGIKTVLAQGKIWSPHMQWGGRTLAFNQWLESDGRSQRVLTLKNLQTQGSVSIGMDLPGFSGFPTVFGETSEPSSGMLYFSQYLDDTNRDTVIDGNDHGVLFRVPLARLQGTDHSKSILKIFPEQLSSVEHNCSIPRPFRDQLFMTCAFEGGLDVYQIPSTGVVPQGWSEKDIWNAHQASRTYSERILLLNTLKYRFGRQDTLSGKLDERLLSNHILSGGTTASQFYIEKLIQQSNPSSALIYKAFSYYIDALALKRVQPSGEEISPQFRREILALDQKVESVESSHRLKSLIRGLLYQLLDQPTDALAFLKGVSFGANQSVAHPLELYAYFELTKWVSSHVHSVDLTHLYHEMMTSNELSEESRISYGFQYLQYLHSGVLDRDTRIKKIEDLTAEVKTSVQSLLKSEALVLAIVGAKTDEKKAQRYRELDQLLSFTRNDYFLRKAISIRAILNFAESGDLKYLNFIATHWIRYTQTDDSEFPLAREVFSQASYDQAYYYWNSEKFKLADNYFYEALTLADDLEAHSGFIQMLHLQNDRKTLDLRYQNLKQRRQIEDNMKFVEALLNLIDSNNYVQVGDGQVKHLDQAIEKFVAMTQERDSPVRHLLLGFCYLNKLTRLSSGYDFDPKLSQLANHHLMLAYDLSRDNPRVMASALMNLGVLHHRTQNFGVAAKFFEKREKWVVHPLGDSARFYWLYSQSLFYSNQHSRAADVLNQFLGSQGSASLSASVQIALKERRAFYLQSAGRYPEAIEAYRGILDKIAGDTNLSKAYLSYGRSLFQLKEFDLAKIALQKSIDFSTPLKSKPASIDRLIDFDPRRIRLIAYGLLAQLGSKGERLAYLELRDQLLVEVGSQTQSELFEDSQAFLIQNRLQMVHLLYQNQPEIAFEKMQQVLAVAEKVAESGSFLSHALYQAVIAFLENGLLNPQQYRKADHEKVAKLREQILEGYRQQLGAAQPVLDYQKHQLNLLWAAYNRRVIGKGSEADLEQVMRSAGENESTLRPLFNALR